MLQNTSDRNLMNATHTSAVDWYEERMKTLVDTPWEAHFILGIYVTFIGAFGIVANGTILLIFMRYKRLRTPANIFVMNLALTDFCTDCFHPMAAYSSFQGRWSFGEHGCQLYALAVGFFGINSIITLSAIACERCIVIASRPFGANRKITRSRAFQICLVIWLQCSILVIPPLFGWSSYGPEGYFTSCSWDYTTRSIANRSYYIYLLIFGFAVPLAVIVVCYSIIYFRVFAHNREMFILTTASQKSSFHQIRRQTDIRIAKVIVMLIAAFFVAWTPYAVISFIGQFGPENYLTPTITAIPAYIAKGATALNPIIYGFSHPQLRFLLKQVLSNSALNRSRHLSGSIVATSTAWNNSRMTSKRMYRLNTFSCSPHLNRYRNYSYNCNRHQRRRLRTFREEDSIEFQERTVNSYSKEFFSDGVIVINRELLASNCYPDGRDNCIKLRTSNGPTPEKKYHRTYGPQYRHALFRSEYGINGASLQKENVFTHL